MTSFMLADPKEELIHQIDTLRGYAKTSVMLGEELSADEANDQVARMRDCLDIGEALGLTKKELVVLLLGQHTESKPSCGCHSCSARDAN